MIGRRSSPRWWFEILFIFTPTWGRFPIWRAYFSNGLKPPTSLLLGRYLFTGYLELREGSLPCRSTDMVAQNAFDGSPGGLATGALLLATGPKVVKKSSKARWAMKKPWLFRIHRGWTTIQLCGDYFINHHKDPGSNKDRYQQYFLGAVFLFSTILVVVSNTPVFQVLLDGGYLAMQVTPLRMQSSAPGWLFLGSGFPINSPKSYKPWLRHWHPLCWNRSWAQEKSKSMTTNGWFTCKCP